MADPITWGLINIVKKGVKGVQTTLDGVKNSVDTLPEDVQTKLDAFEVTIDELKKNVEDTLSDVQETVEKSPAGLPAPPMNIFKATSNANGITIDYKVNMIRGTSNIGSESDTRVDSVTKGVIVRYSDETYPVDMNQGKLAFVDEDVFDIDVSTGKRIEKEKTFDLVGLTNGKTYYLSAFPYSYNYSVDWSAGGETNYKNRTKCQWTGTKGTLTVNVTQDYNYKPLGEYTATMTPTAGGDPITKTQSGAATIVFSGLEAGQYTLSFSEVSGFTKPENKTVTVTAGQSQIQDSQYKLITTLSLLSWSEIDEYAQKGDPSSLWSIGDTKDITVGDETLTVEIIGFNHDDLVSGGKAKLTFCMKNLMRDTRTMFGVIAGNIKFENTNIYDFVTNDCYNNISEDLKPVIKQVYKKVATSTDNSTIKKLPMHLFLLSEVEVFRSISNSHSGEGNRYPKFTSWSDWVKKLDNGSGETTSWWLRSPATDSVQSYCAVYTSTSDESYTTSVTKSLGVCFCFCI